MKARIPSRQIYLLLPEQEGKLMPAEYSKPANTQILGELHTPETKTHSEYRFPDSLQAVEILKPYLRESRAVYTKIWLAEGSKIEDAYSTTRINGQETLPVSEIDFEVETIETLYSLEHSVDLLQINFVVLESRDEQETYLVISRAFRNTEITETGHAISPIETKTEVLALPAGFSALLLHNPDLLRDYGFHLLSDSDTSSNRRGDIEIIQNLSLDTQDTRDHHTTTFSLALLQNDYNNRLNHQKILDAVFCATGMDIESLPIETRQIYDQTIDLLGSGHRVGYTKNGIRLVRQTLGILYITDYLGNKAPLVLSPEGEVYLYLLSDWNNDSFVRDEAEQLMSLIQNNQTTLLDETFRGQGRTGGGGGGLSKITKGIEGELVIDLQGNGTFGSARWLEGNKIIILNAIATQNTDSHALQQTLLSEIRNIQHPNAALRTPEVLAMPYPASPSPLPPLSTNPLNITRTESQTPDSEFPPNPRVYPIPIQPLRTAITTSVENTKPLTETSMTKTEVLLPISPLATHILMPIIIKRPAPRIISYRLPAQFQETATRHRQTRHTTRSYQTNTGESEATLKVRRKTAKEAAAKPAETRHKEQLHRAISSRDTARVEERHQAILDLDNAESTHHARRRHQTHEVNSSSPRQRRRQGSQYLQKSTGQKKTRTSRHTVTQTTSTSDDQSGNDQKQSEIKKHKFTKKQDRHNSNSSKRRKGLKRHTARKKARSVHRKRVLHVGKKIRRNRSAQNRHVVVTKRKAQVVDRQQKSTATHPCSAIRKSTGFRNPNKARKKNRELSIQSDPVYSLLQRFGFSPLQATSLLGHIDLSPKGTITLNNATNLMHLQNIGIEFQKNAEVVLPTTKEILSRQTI